MRILDDARNYFAQSMTRMRNQRKMRKALKLELGDIIIAEVTMEKPHVICGKNYGVLAANPVYSSNGSEKLRLENVIFKFIDDKTTMQELPYNNFKYRKIKL